ncbi:uncharacterized protein VICG_02070 [Vittaforma corneae ATCC 50505]|uniref:Uncharacterized protein n=1 Tax=Vittaforma corneae (strain ATCC 50505) TaxID=993615 RepID=L2GK48_VITCO|nr:uncharacterized protein VICG_02070 [Vittaforma corneae ATCC 50505]ELA40890.1 hypothetical protein VICG_02070 [Vittaforma corneae ATCC 50505]
MNNQRAKKKIVFEPKIPAELPPKAPANTKYEEKTKEQPQEKEIAQPMKGMYAPKTFSSTKEFKMEAHEFILNGNIMNDSDIAGDSTLSLVQFSDGSFGIKCEDRVFECDCSFLGDTICVEVDEKVKKVGSPEFIMTVYPNS